LIEGNPIFPYAPVALGNENSTMEEEYEDGFAYAKALAD